MSDVVCLSHLRWGFVFQRPHHVMSRFARDRRVFFVEEPVFDLDPSEGPRLDVTQPGRKTGLSLFVVVPHLPPGLAPWEVSRTRGMLLSEMFDELEIERPTLWYTSPMALEFSRHLPSCTIVYDCTEDASPFVMSGTTRDFERELLRRAHVVFTSGPSLWESKTLLHDNAHVFPNSVEPDHFGAARGGLPQPSDQVAISHPRVGFFGAIDERIDSALLERIADLRPDWSFVLVGPRAEGDAGALPQRPNVHYLGAKAYHELPAYIAGWDAAMMPFSRNDATRFMCPTKMLEYLAAGRPTVSTTIRDVVRPYGQQGLVAIADEPEEFVRAIEAAFRLRDDDQWLARVDAALAHTSWDRTVEQMDALIQEAADEAELVHRSGTRLIDPSRRPSRARVGA